MSLRRRAATCWAHYSAAAGDCPRNIVMPYAAVVHLAESGGDWTRAFKHRKLLERMFPLTAVDLQANPLFFFYFLRSVSLVLEIVPNAGGTILEGKRT